VCRTRLNETSATDIVGRVTVPEIGGAKRDDNLAQRLAAVPSANNCRVRNDPLTGDDRQTTITRTGGGPRPITAVRKTVFDVFTYRTGLILAT